MYDISHPPPSPYNTNMTVLHPPPFRVTVSYLNASPLTLVLIVKIPLIVRLLRLSADSKFAQILK